MDWQIRIALLVTGIFVIGFIVYDFNRRKKAQAEKERLIDQMRRSAEHVDAAGFDFTGVGSARPVSADDVDTESLETAVVQADESSEPAMSETSKSSVVVSQSVPKKISQNDSNSRAEDSDAKIVKPQQKASPTEQLTLDDNPPQQAPEMVISLILQAEEGKTYHGKDFMPLVLSQGLRHGEMGIFHRHMGSGGKPGAVMYSVANAIKPGTFELANIERFETPAFAFFMTLPGPTEPVAALEGMVKTIKLFQAELGGQILDDSKSVYTEQRYQHQLDTVKEYVTKAGIYNR
ncbi:cell division protein ZipA [Aliikangiella marina]|uniref:Cell division protein ZipA n=1 Tax=Aliikangiella marina TaxID=1712262 RepID=A0A545TI76_9GAMM|nr:cell division protein ZipA [Aliikangiella marina]TQV76913.1 cell division protein ZipA [Aliikangiella marina]